MGLVTYCELCGHDTRPYDDYGKQPCRQCLCAEVERLRAERDAAKDSIKAFLHALGGEPMSDVEGWHYAAELAAEVERLRAEQERLREKLREQKCSCGHQGEHAWDCLANPARSEHDS